MYPNLSVPIWVGQQGQQFPILEMVGSGCAETCPLKLDRRFCVGTIVASIGEAPQLVDTRETDQWPVKNVMK